MSKSSSSSKSCCCYARSLPCITRSSAEDVALGFSGVGFCAMLAEKGFGGGEEVSNERFKMVILFDFVSVFEDAKKLVPVDHVEGPLEVYEDHAALAPHVKDLGDPVCCALSEL